MNKKIIASAVFTALAASSATAGDLSLTAPAAGKPTVPTEIFGTGSSAVALGNFTARYTLTANPESDFFVNVALNGGATFAADLTDGSLVNTDSGGNVGANDADVSISLVAGGTTSDSQARFRVNNASGASGLENNDTLDVTFTVDNADTALGTAGGDIDVEISLTDTLGQLDTTETLEIVDSVDTIGLSMDAGNSAASANTTASDIEVSEDNLKYDGSGDGDGGTVTNEVILGSVVGSLSTLASASNIVVEPTLVAANVAYDAGSFDVTSFSVTVTGEFGAAVGTDSDNNADTVEGAYIDLNDNGSLNGTEAATTITANSATFTYTADEENELFNAATDTRRSIRIVSDGATAIEESGFTGSATIDFSTATSADVSVSGQTLRTFVKNGASQTFQYSLTPGGNFGQFFRVINSSTISGDVSFTMTDDDGNVSDEVDLDALESFSSAEVANGAATDLIDIDEIYAAIQAVDLDFDVDGGKTRVTVNGQFPTMRVDSIAQSKDKQSFVLLNTQTNVLQPQ